MKVLMLGATRGMGRALARACAERGDSLFICGRRAEDLKKSAADLSQRGAARVETAICDLAKPNTHKKALDEAWKKFDGIDTIVVTAGLFGTQETLEDDAALAAKIVHTNFAHTIEFCEVARKKLTAQGGGSLCVFSSVAGDRARKPTVIYGATKAGLSAYLDGLDLRYAKDGLHVLNVKPGFVHTSMTEGLKAPPFAGQPEEVAKIVLKALERKANVVYAPRAWRVVMGVIKKLPGAVMRRVSF